MSRMTTPRALLVTALLAPLAVAALPAQASAVTTAAPRSGIVFTSDRDTPPGEVVRDEIYLYEPATGRTSRLTDSLDAKSFARLSPDGRYLGYVSNFDTIWTCRLRLVADRWSCVSRRPHVGDGAGQFVFTPDSRSLVYTGTDPVDLDADIFSVDLTSLEPAKNLTQEAAGEPAAFDGQPDVSPDGRFVVYGRTGTGGGDLVRRRIDGSNPVKLTNTATASEFGPAYSPDGTRLLFHSNRRTGTDFDLWTMAPRPEGPTNVAVDLTPGVLTPSGTPSNERFGRWSPSGRQITFWLNDITLDPLNFGEIYTVRADGSAVRNVTANNPTDPAAQPVGDISPDWGRLRPATS